MGNIEAIQMEVPSRIRDEEPTDIEYQAAQKYLEALQKKVNDVLKGVLDGPFTSLNYPGGFHYGVYIQGHYNEEALKNIDSTLTKEKDVLVFGDQPFSNMYLEILKDISYNISEEDRRKEDDEYAEIVKNKNDAIKSWKDTVEDIPAGTKNEIAYIRKKISESYKSIEDMKVDYPDFYRAYLRYTNSARTCKIEIEQNDALDLLDAATKNTQNPSNENKGMSIGENSFYPAFEKIPSQKTIENSLGTGTETDPKSYMSTEVTIINLKSEKSNLKITGSAELQIPIAEIINITGTAGVNFTLDKVSQDSTEVSIKMTYYGITMIPSTPKYLSSDLKTGWYVGNVIQQARDNIGKDKTGYTFYDNKYNEYFGEGKKFCRLKTLVICQPPTIIMKFSKVHINDVTMHFDVHGEVSIDILALSKIGGKASGKASIDYTVDKVEKDESKQECVVNLVPTALAGQNPGVDSTTYILGGVVSYNPDHM